jgi:hypothetical protein
MSEPNLVPSSKEGDASLPELGFPSHFLNWILLWAGLSFGLWLGFIIFLGPVWGDQLIALTSLIKDRADFLLSLGEKPHPILGNYEELGFFDRWRCGSLLGALFFSLPLALSSALIESIARQMKHESWRWLSRGTLFIPWVWFQGGLIHHFAISPWTHLWGWALVITLPILLGEGLERLLKNRKTLFPQKTLWILICALALSLLPTLLHPVWDLFLSPRQHPDLDKKFGENTSASIRLTTARDWFLLNEDGQHWFNTWYYGAAPLLMERDRVTNFQPMVVAMVGIDPKTWGKYHQVHFSEHIGFQGPRLRFFEPKHHTDLDNPIFRDQVDYVAMSSKMVSKDFVPPWPDGSYGFFAGGNWKDADGKTKHDQNTFWKKREKVPGGTLYRTPLVERKFQLWNEGLDPEQTALTKNFKTLLFKILNSPSWMGTLGIFGGLGFLVCLTWILSAISRKHSKILILFGLTATVLQGGTWNQAIQFRTAPEGQGFWNEHEILKKASFTLEPSDVVVVLNQAPAEDARLRVLQWLVMGRSFSNVSPKLQKRIEERMGRVIESYSELPFYMRYKLLDACFRIKSLHPALKEKVKNEFHPYVRWYARDKGLDDT